MVKFNPFRPGSVVSPGMFCGRGNELIRIEQCLFQIKHGNPQHFLIEGERGIGKSSLLFWVELLARGQVEGEQNFNFLVSSVELRDSNSYVDIVRTILLDLKREIEKREPLNALISKAWNFASSIEAMGVKYNRAQDLIDRTEPLDDLTETLAKLISGTENQIDGILLLVDEADKPPESANLGELCKLLTERLTRKQCEKVGLGLAGLPALIPKLRQSHESSPRIFTTMTLEPLELNERKEVIARGLNEAKSKNGFETKITDEARDTIAALSEGYPHFIQEFAYCAFDHDLDNHIDRKDVLEGAFAENGALAQLGHKFFSALYIDQIGSDDYRHLLHAMAEHLDSWISRSEIIGDSGLKERTVDNALRALRERNIIIQNDAVRGEYRLPTKSFAVWIKARENARGAGAEFDEPSLKFDPES